MIVVYTSMHQNPSFKLYLLSFFFFNDPATTEIYTLSLHDALPISPSGATCRWQWLPWHPRHPWRILSALDRKSTRLNSSHQIISYAVFCLKKKIVAACSNELCEHNEVKIVTVTILRRATRRDPDV